MPINRIKGSGGDLVDVEELITTTDNINAKKGLVTKSELYARATATRTSPLRMTEPTDSVSNYGYRLWVASHLFAYDGVEWNRWKNNLEGTLLASAARTGTTYSTTQTNYNHKGIYVFLRVTAVTATPSITMALQAITATAGNVLITATSAAISTVGTYVLALHPALVDTAGTFHLACDALLPRTWRLQVSHADADSITYSVDYALIV